jgi:uncharacterized protein
MKSFYYSILAILLFGCIGIILCQDQEIPEIHHRANDLGGLMTGAQVTDLESRLQAFEQETSNQIVVLIVPTLQGESLEDFSLKVCEKNKLGKKGRDNGVLFFIVKNERRMRIEVGYGLEGVLTDALSDQIIRTVVAPRFRVGDYPGGISAGVDAIMLATKGEFQGEPNGGKRNKMSPLAMLIFLLFFGGIVRLLLRGLRRTTMVPGRYYSGGPWFGGFGGGGFGGGFGGGGGFSGGGGSFGGGGASGGW